MKKIFIKKTLLFTLFICLFTSIQAQIGGGSVTIIGDDNVNVNEIKTYTASSPGNPIYSGTWSVTGGGTIGGATILSQNATSATILWSSSGGRTLNYTADSSKLGFMQKSILILVNFSNAPPIPANPSIVSQNCINATLTGLGTSPSGVSWYWQGTNSNGTSTSQSVLSSYIASSSGTYYLRARNLSGIWSVGSSSVSVTMGTIGGTTWYADTDGDQFGDPNITLVQCTQPSGYVSNSDDVCPTIYGQSNYGCPPEYATFGNENYIYKITPQIETTNVSSLMNDEDKIESITYFDGLGRTKQSIDINQSPFKKDIVKHIEYDNFGRQIKDYLPYVDDSNDGLIKSDVENKIKDYYWNHYQSDFTSLSSVNAYSVKGFDSSLFNRVVEQTAPGKDWKIGTLIPTKKYTDGHTIKVEHSSNSLNEVKIYYANTIFANNTYSPILEGGTNSYLPGSLYKTVTKNENWTLLDGFNHTSEEFKNKNGQVILKRSYNNNIKHDTYFVYDNYNNLTYVLPPKVEANDNKPDSIELLNLCYQYKYDNKNRVVEKKLPGKGWEHIIYDKLDRVILTQDVLQRPQKKWLFTKYDAMGRIAYTGVYTHPTSQSRIAIQVFFDNYHIYPTTLYETKATFGVGYQGTYYSNQDFPTTGLEVLAVNYYDDYNFNRSGAGTSITSLNSITSTTKLKGLSTGSRVKILGTNSWITTVNYYDEKARPIYVYSKNDYLLSTDIIKKELDFVGKIIRTESSHTKTDDNIPSTIVVKDDYNYDHVGRLKKLNQTIAGNTETIIENTYNKLGLLENKGVGGKSNANRLQTLNYKYNVRGWLKSINDDSNNDNDLFNFSIKYNDPTNGNALFNGNISQTSWNTLSQDTSTKTYTYSYDALNRITAANTTNYDVSGISYDKNGNILSLKRQGHLDNTTAPTFGEMDNLTYDYDGNKLLKVDDTGIAPIGVKGQFQDKNTSGNDYAYDLNGNMLRDYNKNMTSDILYNHLNLPTRVTINNQHIYYIYDATGTKLRKTVGTEVTDYAGNYIYKKINSAPKILQFFSHAEGYVKNDGGSFKYVYQYKDHLGNIRLSYADFNNDAKITASTEIIEESNYYPFGLTHKGYNNLVNGVHHPYGFTGKEHQDELGLEWIDITARNYDPAIGRWMNLDPLAEQMRRHSPYNYGFDNPIYFIDPDGMKPHGPGNPIIKAIIKKLIKRTGRAGKQARLRRVIIDPKASKADKGWIKNEMRHIKNGNRKTIRNPGNSRNSKKRGKELAHERGREAAKGYDYKHTNLQDRDLHRLQHKYDKNGTLNKERPIKEGAALTIVVTTGSIASSETSEGEQTLMDLNYEMHHFMENVGTKIFGNNAAGEFVNELNELNPFNLGLSEFFKPLTTDAMLNNNITNTFQNYTLPSSFNTIQTAFPIE